MSGTVIAFHGDSTAYRAASQLDAFLTGIPFMGFKHNMGFQHLVVNGNNTAGAKGAALRPAWTSVRFLWSPHFRDLPNARTLLVCTPGLHYVLLHTNVDQSILLGFLYIGLIP